MLTSLLRNREAPCAGNAVAQSSGVVVALYLNVVVGVVQSFQKLSLLQPLAPTQSGAPFIVAQTIVLALFIAFGIVAATQFHPERKAPAF